MNKIKCWDFKYGFYDMIDIDNIKKIVYIEIDCHTSTEKDKVKYFELHGTIFIDVDGRILFSWFDHNQIYDFWKNEKIFYLLTEVEKNHFALYNKELNDLLYEGALPFYLENGNSCIWE